MSDNNLPNEALFDELCNPPETPGGDFVEGNFLEPLFNDELDLSSMPVLADWLEDNDHPELADKIRDKLTKKYLFDIFRRLIGNEMSGCSYRPTGVSRYTAARRQVARDILNLFPSFMQKHCANEVNKFVRMKMQEDGFHRRMMPPTSLSEAALEALPQALLAAIHIEPIKVLDANI